MKLTNDTLTDLFAPRGDEPDALAGLGPCMLWPESLRLWVRRCVGLEMDPFRVSFGEVPVLGERDGERELWTWEVVKGVTNFWVLAGIILDDENEESVDMSKGGSNWIIRPPCIMSLWFPTLCMERWGVGDVR